MQGRVQPMAEGLWRLALRTPTLPPATATNTLLVRGEVFAVIEPASPYPDAHEILDAQIQAQLEAGYRLEYIVLSHHHVDHIGDAERLQTRFGGKICAHPQTAARLAFGVDLEIDEGDVLSLGAGRELRFVFTPGHAPGHLVVEIPDLRVAYVGDLVASEGTILVDPRDDGDMADYLESLRRMRERARRGAQRWVPSHGEVIDTPVQLASDYIEHRLGRERKVLACLERAMPDSLSFEDLLAQSYDDKPAEILPLARGALQAHVDKLLAEHTVIAKAHGYRLRGGGESP